MGVEVAALLEVADQVARPEGRLVVVEQVVPLEARHALAPEHLAHMVEDFTGAARLCRTLLASEHPRDCSLLPSF